MGFSRTSNLELITLPNCGGLRENGTCSWLKVPVCAGAKCRYYNSADSLEKAHERLRSLDEEAKQRIAQKYYGGTRPWMGADTKVQR
ncbi:MAG: hypothetical protein EOM54_07230 [Clostridia bacterium]|nr:hypothetical protein [Clostridia bacterium]